MKDIPQEWIRDYVNKLLDIARTLPNGSTMQSAIMDRAEKAMDLVKAFREDKNA